MSFVDDRGKKLGEYRGRIITLENGVPVVVYNRFEAAKGLKLENERGEEKSSEVKFPDVYVPISSVGGKIPSNKVSGFWLTSIEKDDLEGSITLEGLEELEVEIKTLKECIDFSKEK